MLKWMQIIETDWSRYFTESNPSLSKQVSRLITGCLQIETIHYKTTLVSNPYAALTGLWIVVTGVVMKRVFGIVIVSIMLTSLTACVIVPYPYYGGYSGHHHRHDGWGRHG